MVPTLALVLGLAVNTPEVCFASIFASPGDKLAGGRSPWLKRLVKPSDLGIAHRTRPLGSMVDVINFRTGKIARVPVIDRGPYGKIDEKGRWFNGARDLKRKGRWRGCADLTPATAAKIGHNGYEPVLIKTAPRLMACVTVERNEQTVGISSPDLARRASTDHHLRVSRTRAANPPWRRHHVQVADRRSYRRPRSFG